MNRTAYTATFALLLSLLIGSCKSTQADKIAQIPDSQSSPFFRQSVQPAVAEAIKVTYPSGSPIPASSTFIAGAIEAGHDFDLQRPPLFMYVRRASSRM